MKRRHILYTFLASVALSAAADETVLNIYSRYFDDGQERNSKLATFRLKDISSLEIEEDRSQRLGPSDYMRLSVRTTENGTFNYLIGDIREFQGVKEGWYDYEGGLEPLVYAKVETRPEFWLESSLGYKECHLENVDVAKIRDVKARIEAGEEVSDAERYMTYNVKLSLPCDNQYGFTVKLKGETGVIAEINEDGNIVLYSDQNFTKRVIDYPTEIEFPAGITEAVIPIKMDLSRMDETQLYTNRGRGIRLDEVIFVDGTPEHVKNAIKCPMSTDGNKPYAFVVGYTVIVDDPKLLKLDATCVTSNDCEPIEGSINGLFDNDLRTFFHSAWTVENERSAPFGSYLQVEIPGGKSVSAVAIAITASTLGYSVSPREIHLYCSNTPDDDASWVRFGEEEMSKGITRKLERGETRMFGDPIDKMIQAPMPFRYLRICVASNEKGESLFETNKQIYWNLGELKVFAE